MLTNYALVIILAVVGILLQIVFICREHTENYVAADILKGAASLCFVLIGVIASSVGKNGSFASKIVAGLVCGMIGDILLNLRFVFKKNGQKFFLAGILAFLIGHILYLTAIVPESVHTLAGVCIGAVLAAGLLTYIFKTMDVKIAFKIFGVFYLGAVIIMTVLAIDIAVFAPSARALMYAVGAFLFMASDIVLIFNTFSGVTKFSLRITNLSLYYIGQLLIAACLMV